MCIKCKTLQDIEGTDCHCKPVQIIPPLQIDCHICNTDISASTINTCQDCNNPTCNDCNHTYDNSPLCQSCRDDSYYNCETCEDLVHSDNAHSAQDSIYCESCFDAKFCTCSDCSEVIAINNSYTNADGDLICESCRDNYSFCDDCGDLYPPEDIRWCEHCEHSSCTNCGPCSCNDTSNIDLHTHASSLVQIGSDAIADYHPTVSWDFLKDKLDTNDAPFFGVELEIECQSKNKSARKVGQLLAGHAIATHDGSLDNGFEIVFTPHKYQAFRKLNFTHILKELSKTEATSHDSGTCGLHIHLQKTQWFTKRIYYKDTYYYNSDLYQRFYNLLSEDITKLSRRTPEQIANYCNFQRSRGSRYSAVNLCPDETVEIRIWRGTLNPKRFKANLQFTLAVYDFLQQHSKSIVFHSNTDKLKQIFRDWLQRTQEYQHLVQYCKSKKLFGFTYRKPSRNLELPFNNSRPAQHASQLTDSERVALGIYS